MSFLGELKRRNVFRVALAYVVGAWVLLQIVDFVLDAISAPNWILQVFILLAAVGLPVVLILAWVFELTPEGIRRESQIDRSRSIAPQTGRKLDRVIIGFLAVAVVILLMDRFIATNPPGGVAIAPADSAAVPVNSGIRDGNGVSENVTPAGEAVPNAGSSDKSIAVLPFVNMSADPDQEYFSDGISEEILNMLVRLPGLKVAGRTSAFTFKGQNAGIEEIGEKLHVSYVLEGSVRKAGERVRITAQLIQVSDGFHLWSESFDRQLRDIFAVQDEIADAIAAALAIELSLAADTSLPASSITQNIAAYERYLEGRGLVARRADFPRAFQLLNKVNEMAPEFAPGWAANAQAHNLSLYYIRDLPRAEVLAESERLAGRALELDPNLAAAYSALGDVHRDRHEWSLAQLNYERALELNPDEVEANEQWAQTLWRAGLIANAARYSARAVELDPLSWINLNVDAALHFLQGERATAWEEWERGRSLTGGTQDYQLRIGINMALNDGDIARAGDIIRMMSDTELPPLAANALEATNELLDRPPEVLSLLREQLAEPNGDAPLKLNWEIWALLAAFLGDQQLSEQLWLAGANMQANRFFTGLDWAYSPLMRPFRQSETFKKLVRAADLDTFWREYQFPDFCRPIGSDDFSCD